MGAILIEFRTQPTRRNVLIGAATIPFFGAPTMADPTEPANIYLDVSTHNCWSMVSLNGMPVTRSTQWRPESTSLPVNYYLQTGHNRLTTTFVPLAAGFDIGAPNPEFAMSTFFSRTALKSRKEDRFTAMQLNYDMTDRRIATPETTAAWPENYGVGDTFFGVAAQPHGNLTVTEGEFINDFGERTPATEITRMVTVMDTLPTFAFAQAPILRDTADLRSEIISVYSALHSAFLQKTVGAIMPWFEKAWTHTAEAMNFDNLARYVESARIGEGLQDGEFVFGALDLPNPANLKLEFLAEGRLVRVLPAPIVKVAPGTQDVFVEYPIAFYRDATGKLTIGFVPYV